MFHILPFVYLNLFSHFNCLLWVKADFASQIWEYQGRLIGSLNIASRLSGRFWLSSTLGSLGIFLAAGGLGRIRTSACAMSCRNPWLHRAKSWSTGCHQGPRCWRCSGRKSIGFLIPEHSRWNQADSRCIILWAGVYRWCWVIGEIFLWHIFASFNHPILSRISRQAATASFENHQAMPLTCSRSSPWSRRRTAAPQAGAPLLQIDDNLLCTRYQ